MSNQALAWKAAFGMLLLVFCAASYWMRPSHDAIAADSAVAPAVTVAPVTATSSEPAPVDVQEDTPPVRVQVALHDAQPGAAVQPMRTHLKPHVSGRKVHLAKAPSPRLHNVAFRRKPSPYAIGRQHYPYDPRERHAMRDAP